MVDVNSSIDHNTSTKIVESESTIKPAIPELELNTQIEDMLCDKYAKLAAYQEKFKAYLEEMAKYDSREQKIYFGRYIENLAEEILTQEPNDNFFASLTIQVIEFSEFLGGDGTKKGTPSKEDIEGRRGSTLLSIENDLSGNSEEFNHDVEKIVAKQVTSHARNLATIIPEEAELLNKQALEIEMKFNPQTDLKKPDTREFKKKGEGFWNKLFDAIGSFFFKKSKPKDITFNTEEVVNQKKSEFNELLPDAKLDAFKEIKQCISNDNEKSRPTTLEVQLDKEIDARQKRPVTNEKHPMFWRSKMSQRQEMSQQQEGNQSQGGR